MTAPDVFTQTLSTGQTLTVVYSMDFGEVIITTLLLVLLVTLFLRLALRVTYGHNH